MLNLNHLRAEYRLRSLGLDSLDSNPFLQFKKWFEEAEKAAVKEPNAMSLATSSLQGHPSCRTVLLKSMDSGFTFHTNYLSRKAKELEANPFAALSFHWRELERQVIIEGQVEKLTPEESESYFKNRPRESQLGAWASAQDRVLSSRQELEEAYCIYAEKFGESPISKPPFWGGYRLLPTRFEFWQGRQNRLHDRFEYLQVKDHWQINRLAP